MQRFNRAAALLAVFALSGCAADPQPRPQATVAAHPDLQVFAGFGPNDATIYSVIDGEDGEDTPHGLTVTSEQGWLREAAVYDHGLLIRHYYLHRNGYTFLATHRDAAGDGFVQIWNNRGRVAYSGHVRGDQRWSGHFLAIEFIPNTYGRRQFIAVRIPRWRADIAHTVPV